MQNQHNRKHEAGIKKQAIRDVNFLFFIFFLEVYPELYCGELHSLRAPLVINTTYNYACCCVDIHSFSLSVSVQVLPVV